MKIHLSILLGFVNLIVLSQIDTLNQTDGNGLKQGYWIYYGKDFPNKGYADTSKVEEGKYYDNIKEGLWIKYYPNAVIKSKGYLKHGKSDGNYLSYYQNGTIKEEGNYNNDHHYRVRISYFENGNIEEIKHFDDNGTETDTSFFYYSSGKIARKEINDTLNKILTAIQFDKNGLYLKTQMTVLENRGSFTLLQIKPMVITDSSNNIFGNYQFKLTFDDTPIFREFLLTIYADSTFHLYTYVYESCYNYISENTGNWTIDDRTLQLENVINFPSELKILGNYLISEPKREIDRKKKIYEFKKI